MTIARYDGVDAATLAQRWRLPAVQLHGAIASTMDAAHAAAAAGAAAGAVVLADVQTAGRGRSGGRWSAPPGGAVLVSVIVRPSQAVAVELLSVRVGLALATALGAWSRTPLRLKWPNDVFDAVGKVAGILCEARWRGTRPDWVVVGVGINVREAPRDTDAQVSALRPGSTRLEVLDAVLPALWGAATLDQPSLSVTELAAWRSRDLLAGRSILSPAVGRVAGLSAAGALIVDTVDGPVHCRSGHVILADA